MHYLWIWQLVYITYQSLFVRVAAPVSPPLSSSAAPPTDAVPNYYQNLKNVGIHHPCCDTLQKNMQITIQSNRKPGLHVCVAQGHQIMSKRKMYVSFALCILMTQYVNFMHDVKSREMCHCLLTFFRRQLQSPYLFPQPLIRSSQFIWLHHPCHLP